MSHVKKNLSWKENWKCMKPNMTNPQEYAEIIYIEAPNFDNSRLIDYISWAYIFQRLLAIFEQR